MSDPIGIKKTNDQPIYLLKEIKEERLDPTTLDKPQRQACLLMLANNVLTAVELAHMFGVSAKTIRKDLREIRAELGREVKQWTMEEVLGNLARAAERCSTQAMKQQNTALAWSIERDFAKLLKDWGLVGPRQEQSTITITAQHLGESYDRMKAAMALAMDHRRSGERIDPRDIETTLVAPEEPDETKGLEPDGD